MVLLSVAAWSCCRCIWHLMNEGPAWAFQTGEMWLQTMVGGIFQISPTVGISTFYLTAYFLVEKDDFPTTPFAHWFAWPKLVKSVSRVDDEQPTPWMVSCHKPKIGERYLTVNNEQPMSCAWQCPNVHRGHIHHHHSHRWDHHYQFWSKTGFFWYSTSN